MQYGALLYSTSTLVHVIPCAGETRREEDQQGRHQQRAQAEGHARQVAPQ